MSNVGVDLELLKRERRVMFKVLAFNRKISNKWIAICHSSQKRPFANRFTISCRMKG